MLNAVHNNYTVHVLMVIDAVCQVAGIILQIQSYPLFINILYSHGPGIYMMPDHS